MNAPVFPKSQRSASANSPREVRAAFVYFHEKRTKNAAGIEFKKKDGTPNPRYSATFMFPKLNADPHQCANYMFLWGLAVEAAQKMWPQNVDASGKWVWPQGAQYAVQDGDVPYKSKSKPGQPMPSAEEIAKKNAWRVGYWIVECENYLDQPPAVAKIVGGQVIELPARKINGIDQYKSGDWGYPNLHAYAYQNETFGINFGFDGFCFTKEGELIGSTGPKTAAQMFGNLGTVAPAGAPAPALPGAPAAPLGGPAAPPLPGVMPGTAPSLPTTLTMAPPAPPAPGAALPGLPPIPGR